MRGITSNMQSVTGTSSRTMPGFELMYSTKPSVVEEPQVITEEKLSWRERREQAKEAKRLAGEFSSYPHLLAMKPKEKYLFRSDYFQVDNSYACILGYFHDEGAHDDFPPFWGVDRIPRDLDHEVSVVVLEQVRRMSESWINAKIKVAERIERLDEKEQSEGGTNMSRRKSAKIADDNEIASGEIMDGASYLHVHNRLLVKAPTLEVLDDTIDRIRRLYVDRFGTLKVASYPGEQRKELSTLTSKNEDKRGKGFHYTSVEYAGSYHLVTNGLNDASGEYVGFMVGDVNNSAVLFDVDNWDERVVVADKTIEKHLGRSFYADMWGSKISQAAMLNNHRVVHIVLNNADLDKMNPKFDRISARLDMSRGDINMFEMFGKTEDELSIFPAHLDKVALMVEQAYNATDSDRAIIRGALKEILLEFYVDKGMWMRNAKTNRDRLRVVGIPHEQVPRMQDVYTYFETAHKAMSNKIARDDNLLHAYSVLRLVFQELLDSNGDLFNTFTNEGIDDIDSALRVIYDFSKLMTRGKGLAMAQLVNVMGFAVNNLQAGDVVIIHGAEHIDAGVKQYITERLDQLLQRGGRVAYLYNDVDKMLDDQDFNKFDTADWTILGPMRDVTVVKYQKLLHQDIPPDLERQITSRGQNLSYLRRGYTNVVFRTDLALGVNPRRAETREAARRASENMRQRELGKTNMNEMTSMKNPVKPFFSDQNRGKIRQRTVRKRLIR